MFNSAALLPGGHRKLKSNADPPVNPYDDLDTTRSSGMSTGPDCNAHSPPSLPSSRRSIDPIMRSTRGFRFISRQDSGTWSCSDAVTQTDMSFSSPWLPRRQQADSNPFEDPAYHYHSATASASVSLGNDHTLLVQVMEYPRRPRVRAVGERVGRIRSRLKSVFTGQKKVDPRRKHLVPEKVRCTGEGTHLRYGSMRGYRIVINYTNKDVFGR